MNSIILYLLFPILIFFITCPVSVIAAEKEHDEGDFFSDKQIVSTETIQINCCESSKYFVCLNQSSAANHQPVSSP